METFEYKAMDKRGRTKRGRMDAASVEMVLGRLKSMGYNPLEVNPEKSSGRESRPIGNKHRKGQSSDNLDSLQELQKLQRAQSGDMQALESITLVNLGKCTLEFTHDFPKQGELRLTNAEKLPLLFVEKLHSGVRVFPVGNALEFLSVKIKGILRKRLVIVDQVQRKTTIRFRWFGGGGSLRRAKNIITREKRRAGK